MGLDTRRSLTALREAIEIIRGLLRGDEVRFSGTIFRLDGVKLDYRPRTDIPIYMAARGPQSIKVCGELADGLIVSNMCTADFVAKSVASLHEAARACRPHGSLGRRAVHAVCSGGRPGCRFPRRQARGRRYAAGLLDAGPAAAGREGGTDGRQRHCGS